MMPDQKQDRICSELLKEKYKPEDFELEPYCKNMMNEFINLQFSVVEILYEGIKEDVQGLLKRIKDIPYVKKGIYETTIDVPGQDGLLAKQKSRSILRLITVKKRQKQYALLKH